MDGIRKWNEILRYERESHHWSQQKVAEALRTDAKKVSEWELGKTKPSYKYRARFCKLYHKTAEELGFIGQEFGDEAPDDNPQEEYIGASDTPHEEQVSEQARASYDLSRQQETQILGPHGIITIRQQAPNSSSIPPFTPSIHIVFPGASVSVNRLDLLDASGERAMLIEKPAQGSGYAPQQEAPEPSLLAYPHQSPSTLGLSNGVLHGQLQGSLLFDAGIQMLLLAQQQAFWPPNEFMKRVKLALESSMGMRQRKFSRRQAMELLVSVPVALLSTMQVANSFAAEEVISLCATSLPACWSLFWAGEFSEVEGALPTYFAWLTPLAHQPSKYQESAASLVSQVYQIASLLVLEQEDFGTSLAHCKQASLYGQIAGDPNLQAAALIRQANTFFYRNTLSYLKRHTHILQTYQEAMQYIEDVSPLICGRIYSGLASAQAVLGQKQDALRNIGLAEEAFPEHPDDDPGFLYTYTTRYILHFNEALARLNFEQPGQAWEALTKATTFVPCTGYLGHPFEK
jgi:transcriptional regulator with XRE-family HTH domain